MAYVKKADRMAQAESTAGLSDEELGVGVAEDDAPPTDPFASLWNDPRMAAALDAAVTARLAQMGAGSSPAPALGSDTLVAFTETIRHLIDTNAQQQPGYIKPLPAEEVDRRAAGRVEMFALLDHYKAINLPPAWIVGEDGFFECNNAQEFKQGDRIRMYIPPPESFTADNEPAASVMAAMMQWLGGSTPSIGEQLEAAEQAAHSRQGPIITGAIQPARNPSIVEMVQAAPVVAPPSRRRVMGTIAPERRDVSAAERMSAPRGPDFIGTDAAA